MLLRINRECRPTVLGTVWTKRRRQSAPWIAYSQNRQDSQKLGKGDKTQQSTAATLRDFHSPGFTGGRDRNVISERERQSKGGSERRRAGRREESGTVRSKSRGDHWWRGLDEAGVTANSCLAPASQNCRKILSVSMRLNSHCLRLLAQMPSYAPEGHTFGKTRGPSTTDRYDFSLTHF